MKKVVKGLKRMCRNDDTFMFLILLCIGLIMCACLSRDGFSGAPLDWNNNLSRYLEWGTIKKFFGFGPIVVPRERSKQLKVEGGVKGIANKNDDTPASEQYATAAGGEQYATAAGGIIAGDSGSVPKMERNVGKMVEGIANMNDGMEFKGSLSSCSPGVSVNGLTPKLTRPENPMSMDEDLGVMNDTVSPQNFGCSGNKQGIVGRPSEVMSYGGFSPGYAHADLQFEGGSIFENITQSQSDDPVPLSMSGNKNSGSFGQQGDSYNVTLYYAPWCPHCKNMVPDFKDFQEKHHGKTLGGKIMDILMVNSDEEPDKVKAANVGGFPEIQVNGQKDESFPREKENMERYVKKL